MVILPLTKYPTPRVVLCHHFPRFINCNVFFHPNHCPHALSPSFFQVCFPLSTSPCSSSQPRLLSIPQPCCSFPVSTSLLSGLPHFLYKSYGQPNPQIPTAHSLCFLLSGSALFYGHVPTCLALHLYGQVLDASGQQCLFLALLPALVCTLLARNGSLINVSWTGFNTLLMATLLCQSPS